MATIQPENIGDLVATTLKDLGRMKITMLDTDLQEHYALPMFTKKGGNTNSVDSGYGFQWDLLFNTSNNTRANGWFDTVSLNQADGVKQGQVPYKNITGGYVIEQREIPANSGASKIVDILKVRRHQHLMDWSEKFENYFWGLGFTTDAKVMYGLKYWCVKNATAGFNGGLPTGQTTVGGIVPSSQPRWQNYTAPYTNVTKDDMIAALRTAATVTKFKKPVQSGLSDFNTGDKYQFYTTLTVQQKFENVAESQNDDLGDDVDSMHGNVSFRKMPINWVPILDADSDAPFYGVNWGVMKLAYMKGWFQKEHVEANTPGQPTVTSVYVNSTLNPICYDRRKLFVLSNGTTNN